MRGNQQGRSLERDRMNIKELPEFGSRRLRGEPLRAYRAYLVYRDLGPGRTLRGAWRRHREESRKRRGSRGRPRLAKQESGPAGQWTQWSSQYRWVERAAVYDADVDQQQGQTRRHQIEK